MESNSLLQAKHIHKWYGDGKTKKVVLDNLNLSVHEGEFVALLGPSGCGKSTFLRILAGLIPPSTGHVMVNGKSLAGPNHYAAIVFQNFALYPWLTVRENVSLGLIAKNISKDEKEKRIKEVIEIIGLKGFEEAFPKEISGGMKQRVGFARALVVQPEILFMDEPFSALDVLTAENLRHELLSLWLEKKIPTKTIVMVTHNIDEAVSMADRMFVLSANPGRFRVEVPGLSVEKRKTKTPERLQLVDSIYQIMTNPHVSPAKLIHGVQELSVAEEKSAYQVLPLVSIHTMKGFLKGIAAFGGKVDLHSVQNTVSVAEMLHLTSLIDILGFGGIEGNKILLTEVGLAFANALQEKAREILRTQAEGNIVLIQYIIKRLQESPHHTMEEREVIEHLEQYFPTEDAMLQFRAAIDIGSYTQLFSYNHRSKKLISLV